MKFIKINYFNFRTAVVAILTTSSLFLTGCFSNTGEKAAQQNAATSGTGLTTTPSPGAGFAAPSPTAGFTLEMSHARLFSSSSGGTGSGTGTGTGSSGTAPNVQIYFNSSLANGATVDTLCNPTTAGSGSGGASGTFPCLCRFTWQDINPATGIGFSRTVDTPFTSVSAFSSTCTAPPVWDAEIADGKSISLTIKADAARGNTASFTVNQITIIKTATSTNTGDFRDVEGRAIKNMYHYVCHDMFQKPLSIEHSEKPGKPRTGTNPPAPPMVKLANRFRVTNSDYSSQAYWYDLYLPTDDPGQFNLENQALRCPLIQVLKSGALTNRPFPLDSTYALALQQSRNYTVPVIASTTLDLAAPTVNSGVLGYASKPNGDGTCPSFPDSTGLTRRTFRLRRYVVNYPLRYEASGRLVPNQVQMANVVYIMDRPVDKIGQDPLKPLTRLGPKPCPFSFANTRPYFITGPDAPTAGPDYTCTMPSWKLPTEFFTNSRAQLGIPDGKKKGLSYDRLSYTTAGSSVTMGNSATFCLPNGTSTGGVQYADTNAASSCATGTPFGVSPDTSTYYNDDVTPINIDGTSIHDKECPIYPPPAWNLSITGALHIKPLRGFVPEFLEDTRFQACAFQSSKPTDPDIVTAHNGYQVRAGDAATDDPKQVRDFYCARTYPDPLWFQSTGSGAASTKAPGNCDSGRPKYKDIATHKYYIPKGTSTSASTKSGYADLASASPTARTVPDAVLSSFAIMNERSYSCAFTYNPALRVPYGDRNQLTDLVTPRSGCCQRCSGAQKTGGCSRLGLEMTAANRGIHSLVDGYPSTGTGGAYYNKYGKPAFTMQSVLLSSAPMQTIPNQGKINVNAASTCYDANTGDLSNADCFTMGSTIVTGSNNGGPWTNDSVGTPMGCYDPSEDP